MPAPGTLLLLRHGQSVLNARCRFTGLLGPPLDCSASPLNRLLEITDEDPSLPYGPTGTHLNDADAT